MLQGWVILITAFAYLGGLFALASWADRRADEGRSVIGRPSVYALSLAVYCTSWTFYGSVGRAASRGAEFLTIYLGPTLMAALSWLILRKIVRISKINRITSIADFISARYGKSATLGGLVTIIATLGVVPYIALQLKAVSTSITVLLHYPDVVTRAAPGESPSDITPPEAWILITSTPCLSCARVRWRTWSGPSASLKSRSSGNDDTLTCGA